MKYAITSPSDFQIRFQLKEYLEQSTETIHVLVTSNHLAFAGPDLCLLLEEYNIRHVWGNLKAPQFYFLKEWEFHIGV